MLAHFLPPHMCCLYGRSELLPCLSKDALAANSQSKKGTPDLTAMRICMIRRLWLDNSINQAPYHSERLAAKSRKWYLAMRHAYGCGEFPSPH